jgi:hypothetical protein
MRSPSGGHLLRERHRAVEQVSLNYAIDQADRESFRPFDRRGRHQHVHGFSDAHQTRQSLCAFGAWNNADGHLGHAELRVLQGHSVIGGHGDFDAATQRGAVHSHDGGFRAVFHRSEKVVQIGPFSSAREFGQIGARDEGLTRPDDDDGVDVGIGLGRLQRRGQTLGNSRRNGIYGRIIDRDHSHAAAAG